MSKTVATLLGGLGRLLISAGLITLAFAVFQLWGTGLTESQAQGSLNDELNETLQARELAYQEESTTDAAAPELTGDDVPKIGQPFGRIKIPKIGLEKAIVEGVSRDDLRQAPGHYPDTPLPGQAGNASIAGHRTTYGQPFHDLDKLVPGDKIEVETLQGSFTYVVEGHPVDGPEGVTEVGHQIVLPTDVDVIADKGDNRLTLTACHPKYSARERIIVSAVLEAEPAPPTPRPEPVSIDDEDSFEDSLGWNYDQTKPTAFWALMSLGVVAFAYLVGRIWRRRLTYALASPGFAVTLLTCFFYLDKLLPAV